MLKRDAVERLNYKYNEDKIYNNHYNLADAFFKRL